MPPPGDVEWARLSWTIITALGTAMVAVATGVWAVFTWMAQRAKDRRTERQRIAALYDHPFLFATEELQSRLYNILELGGLGPLTDPASPHPFAEETAYLVAQYFGWERTILRHGPYTADAEVIRLTRAIRNAFATDSLGPELRFFHPEQGAIGQLMMRRVQGQLGSEVEVVPFDEFRRALRPPAPRRGLGALLGCRPGPAEAPAFAEISSLRRMVDALRAVKDTKSPPGDRRLARVQAGLVELLTYLEAKEKLALFPGRRSVAHQR
jgi:hypothetical protein